MCYYFDGCRDARLHEDAFKYAFIMKAVDMIPNHKSDQNWLIVALGMLRGRIQHGISLPSRMLSLIHPNIACVLVHETQQLHLISSNCGSISSAPDTDKISQFKDVSPVKT